MDHDMETKKTKTETTKETAAPKQIFDIARPGTLPPASATARPVIVTNRVLMQDPMMVPVKHSAGEIAENDASGNLPIQPSPKIIVAPLSAGETEAGSGETVASNVAANTQNVSASSVDGIAPTGKQPAEEPPKPASPGVLDAAPPVSDATDEFGEADQKSLAQQTAEAEAKIKAEEEYNKLIDEKTYFLPINSVENRRSKHVFTFGALLILVLVLLWVDIAMDAGFVTIPGIQPLTHLFSH